jgi:U5 small nuclear ribonucleoprotein component
MYIHTLAGDLTTELAENMKRCSSEGPMAMQIVKLYHKPDCASFDAFGRVVSGTIKIGDVVSVLGEGYTLEDDEDMTVKTVTDIWCVPAACLNTCVGTVLCL